MSGGIAPALTTIGWYRAKRALMTGLVVVGAGSGSFLTPPVANILVASFGWRVSFLILGLVAAVVITGVAQLFRREPSDKRFLPYGSRPAGSDSDGAPAEGLPPEEASRTLQLWILLAFHACASFFIANTTICVTELGAPELEAAAPLSVISSTA